MRGVSTFLALSVALLCGLQARAQAGDIDGVRALAQEKAAAVGILRRKAANELVTVAQDRVFGAYLTATTQGEGERLRKRIVAGLGTLTTRFGVREITMIDRSGEVVVRTAPSAGASEKFDPLNGLVLKAGFALAAYQTNSVLMQQRGSADWTISVVAPIVWRGESEFVLRAEQDGASYRSVLGRGVGAGRYIVLTDEKGTILSDTRQQAPAGKFVVANLSLDALRKLLGGKRDAGTGEVTRGNDHFNVSYQAVGAWTVVAVEPVAPPRRCSKDGVRLCG